MALTSQSMGSQRLRCITRLRQQALHSKLAKGSQLGHGVGLLCKACCLSLVMQRNHCEPILCEVRATPLNLLFRPVLRGPRPWPIRGPQKTDPQIKNKNRGGLRIARKDPSRRGGIDGPNFRPNGPTRTRNGPKTSKKPKNPPKTRGRPRSSYRHMPGSMFTRGFIVYIRGL